MLRADRQDFEVSIIGTLPPLKGISPYCAELTLSLRKHTKIEFIDFKRLYPSRLYPGGAEDGDVYPVEVDHENIVRRKIIDPFNPLTWFAAGMSLKGKTIHAQWWTGFFSPIYMVILGIAKLRGKKIIITVHNVEPHEDDILHHFLNRSILPLGDEFIVHSQACKEKLARLIKRNNRTIHVVPHPPFLSACGDIAGMEREGNQRNLEIFDGQPALLFFGNIRDYKGLDVLLRAMPVVKEVHPRARLVVAGQLWGDWRRYERIIEEEGLRNEVITSLKYLPFGDLCALILASDLAVFPFKKLDSASGSVMLARSLGKPVVVSRVEGLMDMAGEDVFFVEPNHPQSLAVAIDDALRRSANKKDIGLTHSRELQAVSPDAIAQKHLQIYRS